jgi:hypothetical protein
VHGEEEEEEGKLTGGLEGRKGGWKRRSTRRLRRRAVLRRPFGAAVLHGWVGAEERCERCKRWCRTYIG